MKSFVGRRDLHSLLNAEQLPGESFARWNILPGGTICRAEAFCGWQQFAGREFWGWGVLPGG